MYILRIGTKINAKLPSETAKSWLNLNTLRSEMATGGGTHSPVFSLSVFPGAEPKVGRCRSIGLKGSLINT